MIASDTTVKEAASYLARTDAVLAPVIKRAGLTTMRPNNNYYGALVDSIISQQLSVKAAATIERRFCELFGSKDFPAPEAILTKSVDELRAVGLSRGKASYILDLAQRIVDGKLEFTHFGNMSNEEIIKELIAVKGIGEWTAHMFLMFSMGRMDILAIGDLGIRNGIRKLYSLDHAPTPKEVTEIAAKHAWHPYESVACWYIWHSLDNKPVI